MRKTADRVFNVTLEFLVRYRIEERVSGRWIFDIRFWLV